MSWLYGAGALIAAAGVLAAQPPPNVFAAAVARLEAESAAVAWTARPARGVERAGLQRLYGGDATALWVIGNRPTRQAAASIAALAAAGSRGLVDRDYGTDSLSRLASALTAGTGTSAETARFDVLLSRSVTRFVADLHLGRLEPEAVRFHLPDVHEWLDLAAVVRAVSTASDVEHVLASVEPPYAGYAALRRMLARYRALAADTSLRGPSRATRAVRPGADYADAPVLRRFLAALGDIAVVAEETRRADDATPTYDSALVEGVARFQRRHGLDPDGVIGSATMTQLRTPLARRVRQIELTLERWRWLPDEPPDRYVVVNIPAFRLYAFEHDPSAVRPVLAMNAIVGQAEGQHDTPVFVGTMREVVFQPYWDVPPSIARKELVPLFRRRPGYFIEEGFEIVRVGDGGDAARQYPLTPATLARVTEGTLRVRQRPGPSNALGPVKFVFPNEYNVFLHGTPARDLFARARRDYSHGCIRIEQPDELAKLALRGHAAWDATAIDLAMQGARTQHVSMTRPMSVYVLYATAALDEGGNIRFYADIYGHDVALERALALPPVADSSRAVR